MKGTKIKMIFLPPYSPNLNLIERYWKFFKKKVLNNRYYETFVEFKRVCEDFFRKRKKYQSELRTLLSENFHIQPTWKQENSIVSSILLNFLCLNWRQISSAGFNSGEYGGSNKIVIFAGISSSFALCHPAPSITSKACPSFGRCFAKSFKYTFIVQVFA